MASSRRISVAFLGAWETPAVSYRRHCWMTPRQAGVWGALQATPSPWRADYVVIHQGLPARRYHALPPRKTLRLRHEPPDVVARWPWHSLWPGRLGRPAFEQDFRSGTVPMVATWWINMDYDTLVALPPPPKSRALSVIVSAKALVPGHRQRLAFVVLLAGRHPGAVDVFGYGLQAQRLGAAYKGALESDGAFAFERHCKYGGLRDYRYSLCIENSRVRNYYTEKIVDAWLSWTVPLYWGCPNLADYYPREAFIEIDIGAPDAVDEVVRRSREPVSPLTMEAIAEARHLALNRYSTWGTVEHLLGAPRA